MVSYDVCHTIFPQLSQVYFISTMFARSLNMPAHCGMEPFRQSWHFHLKSCKLVLPERSCVHRGEHQSNNFWKLLTGPPFAGDVPLQALVFSNSLSMHQTLYHHSLSTFSPSFFPLHPQQTQTIPDSPSQSTHHTLPTQFFLPYCIALEQPPLVHTGYQAATTI